MLNVRKIIRATLSWSAEPKKMCYYDYKCTENTSRNKGFNIDKL